jgi:hypothetical protein
LFFVFCVVLICMKQYFAFVKFSVDDRMLFTQWNNLS